MASPELLFRHRGEYLGSNYSLTLIKEFSEHKYAVKSDGNWFERRILHQNGGV